MQKAYFFVFLYVEKYCVQYNFFFFELNVDRITDNSSETNLKLEL